MAPPNADNENASASSTPGSGWSNGDIPNRRFSRSDSIVLYGSQRRLINVSSSWSRIGSGSEFDARHSVSGSGESLVTSTAEEAMTIRALISQLCERFYDHGWATGTGGGVSIRCGGPKENRPWRVFVAPSGIQKEDMVGEDIFELDMNQNVVVPPKTPNLRLSACTPLWYVVYRNRPNARSVIHTHSINAQMATLLDPTEKSPVLRITHFEMLKGVGNHAYDDVLEIPIIDNRPSEDQLADQLESVINAYPKANAVLVRRHGVYVWGDSWEQAKTQCESFDYLFETVVRLQQMGLDPAAFPKSGTYRVEKLQNGDAGKETVGFRGAKSVNNDDDVAVTASDVKAVPLLPRNFKTLLLDIEGCTTSISFVKDVLFPFVLSHLNKFLENLSSADLQTLAKGLKDDVDKLDETHGAKVDISKELSGMPVECTPNDDQLRTVISIHVNSMVKHDVKAASLKSMQGQMWEAGYKSGDFKSHVYSDFVPTLQWCQANGVAVHIYSSGSVKAQKLLFGHSTAGDLTPYMTSHFDITTAGNKKEASSYKKIAEALGLDASEIVFVSDSEAELVAARDAGIGRPVMSVREGNAPLTPVGHEFPIVHSLMQLCGSD